MSMLKIGSAETHRVAALPLHMQQKGPPGRTLILFDELPEFPAIAAGLKSFCSDRRYDVICSGPLQGFRFKKMALSSRRATSENPAFLGKRQRNRRMEGSPPTV